MSFLAESLFGEFGNRTVVAVSSLLLSIELPATWREALLPSLLAA